MTAPDNFTATKGFTLLETFFTDHRERLLIETNVPSRLTYLLKHLTFAQLLQAANEEVALRRNQQNDQQTTEYIDCTVPDEALLEWDESIRIESSPTKGRHMKITDCSQAIPTGTYLIREAVLSIAYKADQSFSRCVQCARKIDRKKNQTGFYPCFSCTSAVFCSQRCRLNGTTKNSRSSTHSAECCLTPLFEDCPLALHAFRLVGSLGLKKVVRFYRGQSEMEEDKVQLFHQPLQPNSARFELLDPDSQLRAFAIVDSFVEHREQMNSGQQLEKFRWALKVILLINQRQHYFDNLATTFTADYDQLDKSDFTLLVDRVASLLQKLVFNVFSWSECVDEDEEDDEIDQLNRSHPIANCLCLCVSFANHSCDAAAFWEIDDGLFILSSSRPLNSGDEVTLTYGPHQYIDFHQRQRRLSKYHFTCGCSACLKDVSRLLCLKCTSCYGPVYLTEIITSEMSKRAKCMLCGIQPYKLENYPEVMREVIRTKTCLFAHCRNLEESFDAQVVLSLVGKLTNHLYMHSLPLIRIFSEAWDALLANDGSLDELFQLSSIYLNALTLESKEDRVVQQNWCQDESALQRNLLLSKWWRVLNSNNNFKHTILFEQIASILRGKKVKFEGPIAAAKNEHFIFHSWTVKRLEAVVAALN